MEPDVQVSPNLYELYLLAQIFKILASKRGENVFLANAPRGVVLFLGEQHNVFGCTVHPKQFCIQFLGIPKFTRKGVRNEAFFIIPKVWRNSNLSTKESSFYCRVLVLDIDDTGSVFFRMKRSSIKRFKGSSIANHFARFLLDENHY